MFKAPCAQCGSTTFSEKQRAKVKKAKRTMWVAVGFLIFLQTAIYFGFADELVFPIVYLLEVIGL